MYLEEKLDAFVTPMPGFLNGLAAGFVVLVGMTGREARASRVNMFVRLFQVHLPCVLGKSPAI